MELIEVMNELEALGTEATKKIFMNHGSKEPLFGVRVADLKKIGKKVKNNTSLAKELYETNNYDAMYLAGLIINSKDVDKELLNHWAKNANCYMLAEYTVASVAAETQFAFELAKEWIKSDDEFIKSCGYNTYASALSYFKDEELNFSEIEELLLHIKEDIHNNKERVKYTMNGFVISVGSYVEPLADLAKEVANYIGTVKVNMGKTSCKVPLASTYIEKIIDSGRCGKKRKATRC